MSLFLRQDFNWFEVYGRTVLNNIGPRATLFTIDDNSAGPLSYLHLIDGIEPQITLLDTMGLLYPHRLYHYRGHQTDIK